MTELDRTSWSAGYVAGLDHGVPGGLAGLEWADRGFGAMGRNRSGLFPPRGSGGPGWEDAEFGSQAISWVCFTLLEKGKLLQPR